MTTAPVSPGRPIQERLEDATGRVWTGRRGREILCLDMNRLLRPRAQIENHAGFGIAANRFVALIQMLRETLIVLQPPGRRRRDHQVSRALGPQGFHLLNGLLAIGGGIPAKTARSPPGGLSILPSLPLPPRP